MRDHDPALGRYIQSDPIGLEGGPNVYGYVGQDPLNNVDPNDEWGFLLRPSAGFAVGFLTDAGMQWQQTGKFKCIDWGEAVLGGVLGAIGGQAVGGIKYGRGWEWSHSLPERLIRR